MPFKCVVPGCTSNYYHIPGTPSVQMIKFPQNPGLVAEWLKAIHRPHFEPSKYAHVCIKHFAAKDLENCRLINCRRVHKGEAFTDPEAEPVVRWKVCPRAVPSVFEVDPASHIIGRRNYKAMTAKIQDTPSLLFKALVKVKVEFKPEMWKEGDTEKVEEPVKKRPRGRPRKQLIANENQSVISNDTNLHNTTDLISDQTLSCCALACTNTADTHTMHPIPEDPDLRQRWIQKIDRLAWTPDSDSALCEIHFDLDAWEDKNDGWKVLKTDAVPNLFLHGETIKSWVTLDNEGEVAIKQEIMDVSEQENLERTDESDKDTELLMDDNVFVKHEALEPEINMLEDIEEMSPQEEKRDPFETIYCDIFVKKQDPDSKITEQEDNDVSTTDLENPLSPESIFLNENSESEHSLTAPDKDTNLETSEPTQQGSLDNKNYCVLSKPFSTDRWKIRRRPNAQLSDRYKCPICERRLSRWRNLEIHILKLHPKEDINMIMDSLNIDYPKIKRSRYNKTSPPDPIIQPVVATNNTPIEQTESPPAPTPMEPSSTGDQVQNQLLLLVPNPNPQIQIAPQPPPENLGFTINLANVPPSKRHALRMKLKELVDAVVHKQLDPERIIIAYDRT